MKKTLSIVVLTVFMVFAFAFGASADTFTDVSGHWAESAINEWSKYGIIEGFEGRFRPDANITRGEMATIIQRLMSYQKTTANTFSDLNAEDWYTDPMLRLNAAGIMIGDGAGHANPKATITRQEAITMITRVMGMEGYSYSGDLPYTDTQTMSTWARPYISIMYDQGALSWAGSTIAAKQPITRAEVISMLDSLIVEVWSSSGLYCQHVKGNALIRSSKVYLHNCSIEGNVLVSGKATGVVLEHCDVKKVVSGADNVTVIDDNTGQVSAFYYGSYDVPVAAGAPHNRYQAANFSRDNKNRAFYAEPGIISRSGIDVSQWQNDIDWQKVAADGIDFAFIRLGYRGYEVGSLNLDTKYYQNMDGAIANGIDVGVYIFSQAINVEEAVAEANMCINYLKDYDITYPVVFDWETVGSETARTNNIDGTVLTDCAMAFCETIENAGYDAMIYSYKNLALRTLDMSRIEKYPFWFAGYTTWPEFYYDFDFWQYSSSGNVDGIQGNTDMDIEFVR